MPHALAHSIQKSVRQWIDIDGWHYPFAVTLTLKQRIGGDGGVSAASESLTPEIASRNLRHWLNVMNKQVYGGAAQRHSTSAPLEMNHKPPILRQSPVAQTATPSEPVKHKRWFVFYGKAENGSIRCLFQGLDGEAGKVRSGACSSAFPDRTVPDRWRRGDRRIRRSPIGQERRTGIPQSFILIRNLEQNQALLM